MKINFTRNLGQVPMGLFLIFIIISSTGFSQKKKPTRTATVPQDTTLSVQEKPQQVQVTDPGLRKDYN